MTNEQKLELANKTKKVLTTLLDAIEQLHEIEVLMVEKAATSLIADAAAMIHSEIITRCKP